ncbi:MULTISPECIES: hypothetical protein [Mycobacterium]|uniref:Uncharacterized protein n=1 Tax=Mycobacterium gordonae TaxID=1778 RepID=A0A1A6BGJ1_MYCGO|nr:MULTISPECIES: hypothetical protein [Mycobacterium]MBX9982458.1 hypothetical protein [Mycobacterium gordonae]MCV7006390.1 hypothetical protein [Mycobacterium gordonae]OBS01354.1 hypothetical protein A9W98_20645 [Mycobacterium gordonae]ODR18880.1 hypothetical protein BHQ23_21495 [Mycobacterium gordonae]ORV92003.1 hypothetical protein AWC08_19915 [Mycobacterium gordonae]
MSTSQLQPRTREFARVLGPYFAIIGITTVARGSEMRTLLTGFESSPVWFWVTGALVLLIGLVIVGLHPYWRGAAAITVSVMGWAITLRGVMLLAFPKAFMAAANATIGMDGMWITASALLAVAGLYLTYVGWRPAPASPTAKAQGAQQDLPRAA